MLLHSIAFTMHSDTPCFCSSHVHQTQHESVCALRYCKAHTPITSPRSGTPPPIGPRNLPLNKSPRYALAASLGPCRHCIITHGYNSAYNSPREPSHGESAFYACIICARCIGCSSGCVSTGKSGSSGCFTCDRCIDCSSNSVSSGVYAAPDNDLPASVKPCGLVQRCHGRYPLGLRELGRYFDAIAAEVVAALGCQV